MDIIVQRELLLKPLQALSGIVEKKQTLPLLANVLLSIKDNQLWLTGTDMEIELIGFVPIIEQQAGGATTVSARKLFDICRALPEGCQVRLLLEKNHLIVRAADSNFKLNTLPADEFPNLEDCEYRVQFSLKQAALKNLFARTYFAMAQQDVRHYLNGTYLDIGKQAITCVAADGHRLALAALEDEALGDTSARVIVPRKSVLELIRLLASETDQSVTLYLADARFRMVTNDFIFTSKLINAQYPDYTRLIPRGTTVALGDRDAIKQALTRASILCNEKFRGVRFQIEPNALRISANNADQEHAEEALGVDYAGEKMEIGFNVAYLLDIVSVIATKTIRFVFTGPGDGVLIEPAEGDVGRYVVMPLRL